MEKIIIVGDGGNYNPTTLQKIQEMIPNSVFIYNSEEEGSITGLVR